MIKVGNYLHYKGDTVEVIGIALHSETLEEMVVYKHISGDKANENHYWVRPLTMFKEDVLIEGEMVPRFKYLD